MSAGLPAPGRASIEVWQSVGAPVEHVWLACSSARGLTNWQADEAEGEARKGGVLRLSWSAFGAQLELRVLELVPYERIVLGHGESTVELSLGNGTVKLCHRGPEAQADSAGLRSSWQLALAQLAHSVERHPGKQRRVQWLLRRTQGSAEAAHLCFTEESLLGRWLGKGQSLGAVGSDYEFQLDQGVRLRGRVLCNATGRDVALSCQAQGDAVLGLRTFPLSRRGRIVALSFSEWGRPSASGSELYGLLGTALTRLVPLLEGTASA